MAFHGHSLPSGASSLTFSASCKAFEVIFATRSAPWRKLAACLPGEQDAAATAPNVVVSAVV